MNVRLNYDFDFTAGIWMDGELRYNRYKIGMHMVTGTENSFNQSTAMERIRYFLGKVSRSVFINSENIEIIEKLIDIGIPVITLPGDPYDQFVELALFRKFNAITEGNIIVTDIELASLFGDYINYLHCDEEDDGPFAMESWWSKSTLEQFDKKLLHKGKNVVKITRYPDWNEVDLGWESEQDDEYEYVVEFTPDNSLAFEKDEN
jgi:hypothetical protein